MSTPAKAKKADTTATDEDHYLATDQKIAEAEAEVRRFQRELVAANNLENTLRARLQRGDETVTAAELAAAAMVVTGDNTAHSAVETRAKHLLMGAQNRLSLAKRTGPFRPTLAAPVAEALGKVLGVSVEVVDTIPTDPGGGRVVYVRQMNRGEADQYDGSLTGVDCEVRMVRDDAHKPLDERVVAKAIDSMRGRLLAGSVSSSESNGRGMDKVIVKAAFFVPRFPVLTRAPQAEVLGKVIAGDGAEVPGAVYGSAELTSRSVKDGDRLVTTVTGTVSIKAAKGYAAISTRATAALLARAEDMIGVGVPGLGGIEKIEAREAISEGPDYATISVKATAVATIAPVIEQDEDDEDDDGMYA